MWWMRCGDNGCPHYGQSRRSQITSCLPIIHQSKPHVEGAPFTYADLEALQGKVRLASWGKLSVGDSNLEREQLILG